MSEFELANKIFDALFDEDDLKEMRQRGFIAQEEGFKLSSIAAIQLEIESQWISVDDELPEVGIKVLCYRPEAEKSADEIIKVSYVLDGKNRSPQGVEHKFECWCHVSHWMPLPQPSKVIK